MTNSGPAQTKAATPDEIRGILGEIEPNALLAIVALKPTVAEVEAASLWLEGDADVFGAGEPLKGTASDIVTILTEDEEEEEPRRG